MLLNKIFEKSFPYPYFDKQKKVIIKTSLTAKEIEKISLAEFSADLNNFKNLLSQLEIKLKIIDDKLFSAFNLKALQLLRNEAAALSAEISQTREGFYPLLNRYRELFKAFISLVTNPSWQSPDFGYSLVPQHGIFQEKIYSFYNDYQRYRAATANVEETFNRAAKAVQSTSHKTWLFNSGMGAFSTLLQALPGFHDASKIAGNNLYFEVFSLLKYQKNIHFFDEENPEKITDFIAENQPQFIFFDPVANSGKLVSFDFKKLFGYYKNKPPEKPVSVICDTTLTAHLFGPADFFTGNLPDNLNIFLYRSLQKLDQYGLDLVTGGIITHYGNLNIPLDSFRQIGTTPTETEVLTLENFGPELTENRFARHGRNAFIMADFLNNLKKAKDSIFANVFHPYLEKKLVPESYRQAPLFFFSLKDFFNLEDSNFFLSELLRIAASHKFNIIAGTSFGFHFSRIMITALPDSPQICFRFASGTEVLEDIFKLQDIFAEINNTFILNLKTAYEKNQMVLLENKLALFNKSLEKISTEKNLEEAYLQAILKLIYDLRGHWVKFKNFKATRNYYNEKTEEIAAALLRLCNRPDIALPLNLKKEIIRSLAEIV
jgi:cystathionine beta-lyase/cystathionine gamma-synthase